MRSRMLVSALLIVLSGVASAGAQENRRQPLVVPLAGEGFVSFKIETVMARSPREASHPLDAQAMFNPQVLADDNHIIHRVLVDAAGRFVFGYDLRIEPVPASRQFRVTVQPLAEEFEAKLRARSSSLSGPLTRSGDERISTLPRSTESQTLQDGDAFALDLLVNAETGVKIVDFVKVSFDRASLWMMTPPSKSPPRDFTLDVVELAVSKYKLSINGETVSGGKPVDYLASALLWFYVPEKGRFIFSLVPREGYDFQKIGLIENNKISFWSGGDYYEWTSSAPIVGGGGTWNVWVLHDPDYTLDFRPPSESAARQKNSRDAEPSKGGSDYDAIEEALRKIQRRDSEFRPAAPLKQGANAPKPLRLYVGGANRIELLLPKK